MSFDEIPRTYRSTIAASWKPEAVYAIRYATRPTALRHEHFYGHDECGDVSMPIDYFVWLVTGPDSAILLDGGFTPATADARPGRIHLGSPLEVAETLGYGPSAIRSVVVSHAHYDHTGYLSYLPEARIHLQEKELSFWTGPSARREMYRSIVDQEDILGLVRSNFDGSLDLYHGDAWIAPGVSVHLVGGHTPGTQIMRVTLDSGDVVVLASDASHFFENFNDERPFSIAHTVPDMFSAFDTIKALARRVDGSPGIIVPGHDPAVKDHFLCPRPDDESLTGRLWQIA